MKAAPGRIGYQRRVWDWWRLERELWEGSVGWPEGFAASIGLVESCRLKGSLALAEEWMGVAAQAKAASRELPDPLAQQVPR